MTWQPQLIHRFPKMIFPLLPLFLAGIVSLFFPYKVRFLISQPLFYVGCILIGIQYLFSAFSNLRTKFAAWINLVKKYELTLMTITVFGLLGWIFGPNLQAEWGPIDDHEIMSALGTDGRLYPHEAWQLWIQGETSHPGVSKRYRPLYYFFRYAETVVWGRNATGWYITRFLLAGAGLLLIWSAVKKIIGLLGGGLLIAYFLTFSLWGDIISRLGPSEAYGLLGFGLVCWTLSQIIPALFIGQLHIDHLKLSTITFFGLGSILCLGTKENYILLFLPLWIIYGLWAIRFNQLPSKIWHWGIVIFGISVVAQIAMFLAVWTASTLAGSDVYFNDTSAITRINSALSGFKHIYAKQLLIMLVLVIESIFYWAIWKKATSLISVSLLTGFGIASSIFIFISQFMFYNRDWPNHSRYDFPGVLLIAGAWVFFIAWVLMVLKRYRLKTSVLLGLRTGLLFGLLTMSVMNGYIDNRVKAERNRDTTKMFTARIKDLAQKLQSRNEKYVVLESKNVWDYEPLFAYALYLKAFAVKQSVGLTMRDLTPADVRPGIETELLEQLLTFSEDGNGL